MPKGFFPRSQLISDRPAPKKPQCSKCGLNASCNSPQMFKQGEGKNKLLIVGDYPSEEDDSMGVLFSEQDYIKQLLRKKKVKFDSSCRLNALACHPTNSNKKQMSASIKYCRPAVIRTIQEHQPEVVVLLGQEASSSVINHYWGKAAGPVSRWERFIVPVQEGNFWLCPLPCPNQIMRESKKDPMPLKWFRHGLLSALKKLGSRPFDTPPDYLSRVEIVLDHREAGRRILAILDNPEAIAFDYETNMLKPDGEDAEILCASICVGGHDTFAFPWYGDVLPAMKRLLRDKRIPKIAANLKFEDRWSRRFDMVVRNWGWDIVLAAHLLDYRPLITGLKFQAFMLLGQKIYNAKIDRLLESDSSRTPNKAKSEISQHQLLTYCGMDSLLTYLIAEIQTGLLRCEEMICVTR